jgi:aminoglycoside phosphotransferase (APT) family kinase protein
VRVRHEGAVLERLRGMRVGDVRVAELLGAFGRGAWQALALREEAGESPLLDGDLVRRMGPFIEALHGRDAVRGPVLAGAFGAALERRLHRLEHGPARHASARASLGRAREGLHRELGTRELPLGWSHGDLAPWNILQGGAGGSAGVTYVVLDWEMASEGAPPLLDLLHLALFQPLQAQRLAPDGLGAHLSRVGAAELLANGLSKIGAGPGALGALVRLYLADRISRLLEDDLLGRDAKRGALIDRMCAALEAVGVGGGL